MLKTALFDYAINEKCCSVTEDGAFALFFRPPPGGFDSSRVPTPGNLPSKAKKMVMPGGRWAQLELTDALLHLIPNFWGTPFERSLPVYAIIGSIPARGLMSPCHKPH